MRVINRLKLGTKINLLVLTVVLLFAGIISYVVMNNMTHGMKGIALENRNRKAVSAMQYGSENVEEGIRKTENVNDAFQSIKQAIDQVTNNVQEVSQTIEGVSSGSKSIVEVMDKVKMTARENAESNETNAAASQQQSAAMEEISASSEALSDMAMDLQAALAKFKF